MRTCKAADATDFAMGLLALHVGLCDHHVHRGPALQLLELTATDAIAVSENLYRIYFTPGWCS